MFADHSAPFSLCRQSVQDVHPGAAGADGAQDGGDGRPRKQQPAAAETSETAAWQPTGHAPSSALTGGPRTGGGAGITQFVCFVCFALTKIRKHLVKCKITVYKH